MRGNHEDFNFLSGVGNTHIDPQGLIRHLNSGEVFTIQGETDIDARKSAVWVLGQISGQDFGSDAAEWREWWKEYMKQIMGWIFIIVGAVSMF